MTPEKTSVEQIASDDGAMGSAPSTRKGAGVPGGSASSHAFPSLRQGYLRAIELAWGGKEERAEFEKRFPNDKDALPNLKQYYGVNFPYNVKFIIKYDGNNQPFFDARLNGKWYAHMDEFVIYLPKAPDQKQDYSVLATEYYKFYPTLLGQPLQDEPRISVELGGSHLRDRDDTGIPEDFWVFGQVVQQMLPLIWSNMAYREAILQKNSPENEKDARQAIADLMNYQVPWNFRLEFREHEKEYPSRQRGETEDALKKRKVRYWLGFFESSKNEIVVNLPLKPTGWRPVDPPTPGAPGSGTPLFGDDQEVMEAVALAAYNATGPMYPFTCG